MRSKRKHAVRVDVVQQPLQGGGEDDAPYTPSKKVRLNVVGDTAEEQRQALASFPVAPEAMVVGTGLVTPAKRPGQVVLDDHKQPEQPRRVLFPSSTDVAAPTAVITPARPSRGAQDRDSPPAKRKLLFGRLVKEISVPDNVRHVYALVRKLTGSLGGNASGGPIYGELTMGSMQKMVDLMKERTGLDSRSRFIDVGSGIGKPSLHVAQDPKVAFSYGIEVDADRWLLGMSCLKHVLHVADQQPKTLPDDERIGHRCLFDHGDVRKAKTFDPFTHVYMFSIGFPPTLWVDLAEMWNRSSSASYLICYHGPKDIIQSYDFKVELIAQSQTSMHGSKEGHSAYIYQRLGTSGATDSGACDPVFAGAWNQVQSGLGSLRLHVETRVMERMSANSAQRTRRQLSSASH